MNENIIGNDNNYKPLVSVITVVKNGEKYIRQTIQSVLAQDYPSIEYIIIDGASTDCTLDIIEEYKERLAYYVSEPDQGIADAWNKGFLASHGEYVAFLNADDYYPQNFIRRSVAASSPNTPQIIYGSTLLVNRGGKNPQVIVNKKFDISRLIYGFDFRHPSCLTHRSVFDLVGLFDVNIRIACDSDLLLRCVINGVSFSRSEGVAVMRMGGISDRQWQRASLEYLSCLEKHGIVDRVTAIRQKLLIPVRYVNMKLRLMPALRILKNQIYYYGLFLINALNTLLPFGACSLLYRICGYRVNSNATIHGGVRFFHVGRLSVGDGTVINRGVYLDNRIGIEIGSSVSVSHDVKIYSLGHEINDDLFTTKGRKVSIGDYAVIFAGAMIMPGVSIGKGAVVMAGSVVIRDVPEFHIVGGNPAVDLGVRDSNPMYRFDSRFYFSH